MQLKAFTLIELSIVIILLGTIFSLALNSYKNSTSKSSITIEDIPYFLKNKHFKDGTLYIYGQNCKNGIYIEREGGKKELTNFSFLKDINTLVKDIDARFEKIDFEDIFIDGKREQVCFKLTYRNGNFTDKFIISSNDTTYLFSPFWQNVEKFDNLYEAKNSYLKEDFLPLSTDIYYHDK